jgi:hypothetical protein
MEVASRPVVNSKRYQRIADSNIRRSIWGHLVLLGADSKTKHGCLSRVLEAGKGTRTLDIQLGKLTLYQLSYAREKDEV